MSSEANALSFLNLYLEPFVPGKNLDLLKLKLIKRARREKARDPGLSEAGLLREIVKVLKKRRKGILSQLDPVEIGNTTFLELLKLSPRTHFCFALAVFARFPSNPSRLLFKPRSRAWSSGEPNSRPNSANISSI